MDDLGYLQTPLVAYGGLIDIDFKPSETIVIAPATGHFGGAAVQVVLAMGAETIIAMGRNEEALKQLQSLDPHVKPLKMTGNMETELEAIKSLADGPFDAVFDISPHMAQGSTHFKAAVNALRRNGRVSIMGGMGQDIAIPAWATIAKNLQYKGKWMYEREDFPGFMRLINSGLLKLGQRGGNEVVGKFGLEEWKEAFDLAAEKARPGQMTLIVP